MNCTVSVHFFWGSSCGGQFVAFVLGNPNTCGLATGTDASGFANVIGDPVLAEDELVSVNVSSLATSRLTLPKFFDEGFLPKSVIRHTQTDPPSGESARAFLASYSPQPRISHEMEFCAATRDRSRLGGRPRPK